MPNSPDEPDRTLSHPARPAWEARPFSGAVAGYTLVRELGRGGMGIVYEALDPGTGRPVALKVLDVEGRGYDLDLALREARLMAKVSHPNTVFLYRAERCDFGLLLAMELVRGGTIADLLRREGRLSPPRAVDLALELVEGLRAYDARGIVHRDIKPSNCFLDRDGRARIGDLGLSRSSETMSRLTREGRFLGTPHYSSPEQLRGEVVDRRSDIYSLGATLYEMIAGRPPIDAPDGVTLVARIMSEEPPPLAGRVPDVPPGLDAAIGRALAKDRERRFASYEELAEALAPFGATSPPVAGMGVRVAAAFGDIALFVILREGLEKILPADLKLREWIPSALIVPYFLLSEGIGRASPMKVAFGLRIAACDGSRAKPARAFARAFVKLVPCVLLLGMLRSKPSNATMVGGLAALVLFAWMIATDLHDRLTGTRVFGLPSKVRARVWYGLVGRLIRPFALSKWIRRSRSLPSAEAGVSELPPADLRFGPFVPRRRLREDGGGTLWAAEDPLLERQVWVRHHAPTEDRCSEARRAVDRLTRLRWIAAGESAGRAWDTLEAPSFALSLSGLRPRERRRPWREARRVLSQLAGEVLAARLDGTMPRDLSLTQVVAGVGGRVLLLDEPCGPEVDGAERFSTKADGLRAFFQVLVCALATGTILGTNEARKHKHLARLPVKDYDVLDALWDPSRDPLETIASIAARLADDPTGPVEIRPGSRLKHILGVSLIGTLAWWNLLAFAAGFRDAFYGDRPTPPTPPLLGGVLAFLLPVVSAVALRGGLSLRLERAEVYTLQGWPAPAWRWLVRSLPLAFAAGAAGYTFFAAGPGLSALIALGLLLVAIVGAALRPACSPGDLLARTRLRPKQD